MSELDLAREWFSYNARARRGYIEAFSKLPPGELRKDRGASYPSLMDILEHTLGAYYFWLSNASEKEGLPRFGPVTDEINDPPLDVIANKESPTLEELIRFEKAFQVQVEAFLGRLVESDLQKRFPVPKTVVAHHRDPTVSVRDMLWHLVEEELQHRGELNALLWQMDVDAPILDWINWGARRAHHED